MSGCLDVVVRSAKENLTEGSTLGSTTELSIWADTVSNVEPEVIGSMSGAEVSFAVEIPEISNSMLSSFS